MSQADEFNDAGEIILKNLRLLDQTTIFYSKEIEPKIRDAINALTQGWLDNNEAQWEGQVDVSTGLIGDPKYPNLWLGIIEWKKGEDGWRAWFQFGQRYDKQESNSREVSNLFNVGDAQYGFLFTIDPSLPFGKSSKRMRMALFDKITAELTELEGQGWIYLDKTGDFFLPISLDAGLLPAAWRNQSLKDALGPFNDALEKLKTASPVFSKILDIASQELPTE